MATTFVWCSEGMAEPLAAKITRQVDVPTVGIGASADCDGQILVREDMLGLNPNPAEFVREYAKLGPDIETAVKAYAADVRARALPGAENVHSMKKSAWRPRTSGMLTSGGACRRDIPANRCP